MSVASTAVRLAQDNFARLSDSTVLLIGAGETIELAARHLVEAKAQRLLGEAEQLAARLAGVTDRTDEQVPQSGAAQGTIEVQKAMAARG